MICAEIDRHIAAGKADKVPSVNPATYIGLPFVARDEAGNGFECWDLVREVYADQARIALESYGDIAACDLAAVAGAFAEGVASETWVQAARPRALDVVVMRAREKGLGVRNRHCGVMIDGTRMLHLEINTATVLVPVTHPSVKFRIVGYFRHRDLA